MKEISVADVIKYLSVSFFYFILGCSFGMFTGFLLFFFNKTLLQKIIDIFIKRITFGAQYVGSYKLWFILNNLFVVLLMVVAVLLVMTVVLRRRRPIKFFKRFARVEENRPKVTLFSLYMIPIGAMMINGFLVTLLLIYTLMNFGYQNFETLFLFLLPHGISEILGLLFSSALALAYLEVLKPYILNRQWEKAKKIGKQLLLSKTTAMVVFLIILLIIFSGFIEGNLTVLSQ